MLGSVIGNPGTGKTLLVTKMGCDSASKKHPVKANYHISHKHVSMLNVKEFLDLNERMSCLVILDELYVWFDSRASGSKLNKAISKVVFQSRKRGLDILYTVQLDSSVDKRLRELCDFKIYALPPTRKGFRYGLMSPWKRRPAFFNLPYAEARKYFKKYDTREIVDLEIKQTLGEAM